MAPLDSLLKPIAEILKRLGRKYGGQQPVTGQIAEPKDPDNRFEPCHCLLRVGIACKIWGEDVLCFYGVSTGVLDLFLLVSNPEEASKRLVDQGYIRTAPNRRFAHIPELSSQAPSVLAERVMETSSISSDNPGLLEADDTVLPGVVLLPATDWNYSLPISVADLHELIPSLHEDFNCIVEKWMDIPVDMDDLRRHLAVHIVYHSLYLDEVQVNRPRKTPMVWISSS